MTEQFMIVKINYLDSRAEAMFFSVGYNCTVES